MDKSFHPHKMMVYNHSPMYPINSGLVKFAPIPSSWKIPQRGWALHYLCCGDKYSLELWNIAQVIITPWIIRHQKNQSAPTMQKYIICGISVMIIPQWTSVNTLRPRQNDWRFRDGIFKYIFLVEIVFILTKIWLKCMYVHENLIGNTSALVLLMAWRWTGDKPLSKP